ncbi:putative membrane protein [Serinibacter arcticus]|uniref:Putative membrane protein n=1 Tax=Serinibacter arcticus TaxID=1655435 RepID=A0A4Z1E4C5_9MICO|nr:putative membrane protein [Serinibacter arcticus]
MRRRGSATGRATGATPSPAEAASSPARTIGRIALGAILIFAGISHLTFAREEFQAQVPGWFPLDEDLVVVGSGLVEITLGGSLLLARGRRRIQVGWIVAAFFVIIFPGNIAQYLERTDGFGLDTDAKRLARLPGQVGLVLLALWSTGAWRAWREGRRRD